MEFQSNPYSLPLVFTAAATGALGIYAFRRRGAGAGAAAFTGMLSAVTIWALGDALLYWSAEFPTQYLWMRIRYLGILTVPIFWLIFAAKFTNQADWISQPVRIGFGLGFLLLFALVWTNDSHQLWWSSIRQVQFLGFSGVLSEWGVAFWVNTIFAYLLVLGGIGLIMRKLIGASEDFRGQYAAIAVAVFAPLLGNVLFLLGIPSIEGLDVTPFMFAISAIAFAWVVLPNRIFDVIPRAYGAVIQQLSDGIIVTDAADKVVEINAAALELFQDAEVGKMLSECLSNWPHLLQEIRSTPEGEQEVVVQVNGISTPMELSVSTLRNLRGDHTGKLIHLRDISRRVQTEADLERTQRDFYSIIEDLEDPYFEADLKGRFIYVNQALAAYTGYDADELIGESGRKIFTSKSIPLVFEVFSEVIATGQQLQRVEFEWLTRDQEERHGEMSVSVIRSREGQVIGTRGIVHDVTDLVRAEIAVREERDVAARELEIGRQIQTGFFPTGLPSPQGWEIAARFQAAQRVSGDFYDSFEVGDENHIALVVADVCDKGVGAALFMALFRSLIRAFSDEGFSTRNIGQEGRPGIEETLKRIVTRTNDYIAEVHSRSNMFATLFFALLDPATGVLHYVNAGHDPPIVVGSEGIAARLVPTGPAVGMLPGLPFDTGLVTLIPGDIMLAFTDGVIDARNPAGIPFGENHLLELLDDPPPSASAISDLISDLMAQHIRDGDQFDDITLLAVRRERISKEEPLELILEADRHSLATARRFVEQSCKGMELNDEMTFAFKLAVDEACTNVIQHAYGESAEGHMKLVFEHQRDKVRLTVVDWGRSFHLEQVPVPDLWSGWQERPEGGLGLFLIREKMDELTYDADERLGNRLTMGKFLSFDSRRQNATAV